jgi:hypothetical protein
MRRFLLGPWPTLGISDARSAARALHVQVKQHGADPIAQRRRERAVGEAARVGIGTLAAVLDLYGTKRGNAQKAWGEARKRIDLLFKPLLSRPAEAVTRQDLQILADTYGSQSSASYAVRSLRPALKWAAQRAYVVEDTTRIFPPPSGQAPQAGSKPRGTGGAASRVAIRRGRRCRSAPVLSTDRPCRRVSTALAANRPRCGHPDTSHQGRRQSHGPFAGAAWRGD